MSKKYDIEVEYKVTEALTVEANSIDEAEEKALELVALNVTDKNIVGDTQDQAEIVSSKEHS
jgi:hypothetical protein